MNNTALVHKRKYRYPESYAQATEKTVMASNAHTVLSND
jgi:hypothetical protein